MPLDGSNYETELTRWLVEGRKNLLRVGWHPGPGAHGVGGVCMLAALPVWGRENWKVIAIADVLSRAIDYLHGSPLTSPSVAMFNDTPGRTLDEVLAVYDLAIAISRE